jgi:hypothetical protein
MTGTGGAVPAGYSCIGTAPADDDGLSGVVLVGSPNDAVHVGDVAQNIDTRMIGAGDRRPYRVGPKQSTSLS